MQCRVLFPLVLLTLVTACGDSDRAKDPNAERDPAISGALSDPIMADPDLTTQNRGSAALSGGGPAAGEIPPDKRGQDEIDAARQQALDLAGGALASAPAPARSDDSSPLDAAAGAVGIAQALGLGAKGCAQALEYSAIWAARLPASLPVYPRGHAGEVAGTDKPGCKLRVVGFVTPVDPGDVIDFYFTMAGKAHLPAERAKAGVDDLLRGGSAAQGYAVAARSLPGGMTRVELVTSGL